MNTDRKSSRTGNGCIAKLLYALASGSSHICHGRIIISRIPVEAFAIAAA